MSAGQGLTRGEVQRVGAGWTNAGLGCCLLGVFLLGYAFRGPGPTSPFGLMGLAAIAVGWVLFGYVIWRRTRYVRAHQSKG